MSAPLCRTPHHDSLSRDHLLHVADSGRSLPVKIAVGALLGLLLAAVGNLTDEPRPIDRLALPAEAPPTVSVDRR